MNANPMCRIADGDLLRRLMQRTGTGEQLTIRDLAERASVSFATIGALCTGTQQHIPEAKARKIAEVIGVDLLVLFIPVERAGRSYVPIHALSGAAA